MNKDESNSWRGAGVCEFFSFCAMRIKLGSSGGEWRDVVALVATKDLGTTLQARMVQPEPENPNYGKLKIARQTHRLCRHTN